MKRIACVLLMCAMLLSAAAAETFADVVLEAEATREELRSVLSAPQTGYAYRVAAMDRMITCMSEGRLGSESELWEIADAFGFVYDESKTMIDNANRLYEFLSARLAWYADDDYQSISSFMTDVASAVSSSYQLKTLGVTWTFYNDVWTAKFDKDDLGEIVAALTLHTQFVGLTTAEFYDLFMQIGQFFQLPW